MLFAGRPIIVAVAAGAVCAAALIALWPQARAAGEVLWAQDDPASLSDAQMKVALGGADAVVRRIEDALAANDAELAQSFIDLAVTNGVAIPETVTTRVAQAVEVENSAAHAATRFATGLVTGEADDLASLSGTVAGDLFVFGDIRDVVREGKRLATGEEPDRLVLGLATAGLAITAATYVSVGGAAPVRAGLTLVKDARKTGRLGAGLAGWAGRSARDVVDTAMLREAVTTASVARPGASITAIKAAFRAEKAGALLRAAKDVGRVSERVGTRGALETLRVAEGPKDIARAARLAEAKGGQTRAILKLLGRGALLLAAGAFNLTLWVFWAVLALFGVLSSIKATTERATYWWIGRAKARKKVRKARRQAAAMAATDALTSPRPPVELVHNTLAAPA
ncbi:hypothetical protein [Bradyrhizobium prioriisuperbiae]|uniref:hypothetical protein n=1 Tax=Bradyrhizobium prioriisuperbiae TaxID=2854389 RepID=UPI0028F0CB71|nr:hypothetical protein [Bradyrhizobium prioritasuperba]